LPGSQAVAAIRKGRRLYMLQFSPEDMEAEHEWFRESHRPSPFAAEVHRESRR
jgi:hypothetical protein